MGNPTLVQRPGSSKSPAWDYSPAFFSQVPDRFNQTTQRWDVHEYDTLGRMTRWDEVQIDPAVLQPGDPSLITRTFDYDGLGRVVRHTMDDDPRVPGLTSDTLLVYDANNQAVYEERTIDRWETITRWAAERIDWGTTGVAQDVTLQLLPMLRAQNGELRWVMADQSGAAFQIWESDGTELQFELGGVYGGRLDDPTADWFHENPAVTTFGDWRLDGLHGSEPDRARGLVHHGARHTLLDDGRWLQPEPLLALGATGPSVGTNYAAYAAGNPLQNQDRTGFSPGAVTHDDNFFVQLGVAAMDEFNSSANLAAAPNPAGAGVAGIVTSVRVLSTAALNTARAVASRAGTTYLHNTATVNGLGLGAAEAAAGVPVGVTVVGAGGMVDDATAVIGNAVSKVASKAGACFVAGTMVATPDGPRPIESLQVGDLVYAYDEAARLDVASSVARLFVRMAPEVIDAEVQYADGAADTLTGTPNHPFWVPAVRDYVPLGKLEVGTVLHVQGGGEAMLVSKTWRQGDFEVFDFEVAGLHNFYVRGSGSDAAGVLVHNSTGGEVVYRHVDGGATNYIGITSNAGRRAGEHAADAGKSGTMEVLTGAVDHDTARTIEGKLIREKLAEARAEGLWAGT